ncbi:hypothetical protein EDB80DRAFT_681984 [Ilyonectria destructans]|nr:hypothetical protein EDB80DRAFT_681984 [Ilyonectria destructans]
MPNEVVTSARHQQYRLRKLAYRLSYLGLGRTGRPRERTGAGRGELDTPGAALGYERDLAGDVHVEDGHVYYRGAVVLKQDIDVVGLSQGAAAVLLDDPIGVAVVNRAECNSQAVLELLLQALADLSGCKLHPMACGQDQILPILLELHYRIAVLLGVSATKVLGPVNGVLEYIELFRIGSQPLVQGLLHQKRQDAFPRN